MRELRRAIVLFAAAVCLLSGCGAGVRPEGASGQEKQDVTIILKAPAQEMNCVSNPEITNTQAFLERVGQAFAAQYEDANVTIDVKMFALADEVSAITETFDTEDAPDILYEGYFNMAGYIHTGRVVPLDDMITDAIRADIYDSAWTISMTNGNTYMMPFLTMQNILIYNKAYFRSCGLDSYCGEGTEIQNWTMDEWTEILDTLAANLPEDVHPLAMYGKNNQGDTHIMSYLRAFGSEIFDADGNFDLESPEAVQALTWLQSGVERGWYPPHPENLEMKDCSELFSTKKLALYNFNGANKSLYDDLSNYGFVNYPGDVATSFPNGFEIFDNGDDAKIRIAKAFLRYLYETPEWLELSAGNIPMSKTVSKKYAGQITMLSDFAANSSHVVDFMNNSPNWQGSSDSVRSVFYPHIADLLAGRVTPEECAAGLNADCNAALASGRERSVLHQ